MNRLVIILILVNLSSAALSQRGDELLVYSVKGQVTAVFKNQETAVKIGRLLLPGTTIRAQKGSAVTMVCKKGKPVHIYKEGVYPVSLWKDSCRTSAASITSNYFAYVWSELYKYTPEYKETQLAVSRGDPPYRIKRFAGGKLRIDIAAGLDTLNYDGENFPLSWTCFDYNGKYSFRLYDSKGIKLLYSDSILENFIRMDSLKNFLEQGRSYRWTVSAARSGVIKKRVINYISPSVIIRFIDSIQKVTEPGEDSASLYFRVAYMLEKKHYMASAYRWYAKATEANPSVELFRDKFIRFRNEYWIR
jgi:hypothetical protein